MLDDRLQCPDCGAAMTDRGGGVFECPYCHHEFDENKPPVEAEPEPVKRYSGPGFKQPWRPPGADPPVTDTTIDPVLSSAPAVPMGTQFPVGHTPDETDTAIPYYPTLVSEKHWYYLIQLILLVLQCVGMLLFFLFIPLLTTVILGGIYLILLRYFLYESPRFGKWGCLLIQVVYIVLPAVVYFLWNTIRTLAQSHQALAVGMSYIGTSLISLLVNIGFAVWLITILWRDIKVLNAEHRARPEFMG